MAAVASCPNREVLHRLLLGHVAGPEGERLTEHLEQCPHCTGVVETLRGGDTLTEAARAASTVVSGSEGAVVRGLVERLCREGPPVVGVPVTPTLPQARAAGGSFGFLTPPQ